jgi:hypothetical protein
MIKSPCTGVRDTVLALQLQRQIRDFHVSCIQRKHFKPRQMVNTHPCPKTLHKDTIQLSLHHFCDTSLITACAIFCSLKFHIVCTCTFFGDTICPLINRKTIKIVTLIDLHIVLTYDCWHRFLVFNIWVSRASEMTINLVFIYMYSTQPFTHSKFYLSNSFLFGAIPCHK